MEGIFQKWLKHCHRYTFIKCMTHNYHLSHISQFIPIKYFSEPGMSGYGKPGHMKQTIATKLILRVQSVTHDTPKHQIDTLLSDIASNIIEYEPYELIDLTYFLTRLNRFGCQEVALPLLHRFFSLPNRNSYANGVYIHRLLRSLFIFQDAVYREWIYEIADLVGSRHSHLLMRDLQLIVDDLSLFYDANAQYILSNFENSIISRATEIELFRIPFFIHSLGRSGYSSLYVAKALFDAMEKLYKGTEYYYRYESLGLILKGYGNFKFHPGTHFLNTVQENINEDLDTVDFKYLSWSAEGLLRMRHFSRAYVILDEIISNVNNLSHLELTDLEANLWHIQSFIISTKLKDRVLPGCIWQENVHTRVDDSEIEIEIDYGDENMAKLYEYYQKIMNIIKEKLTEHIYDCTPPYRASQFELLTRILEFCPYPRDFSMNLPLSKYDLTYPIPDTCDQIFRIYPFDKDTVELLMGNSNNVLKNTESHDISPLPLHLKTYLHALAFRTPALAPRGLRLFLHGLVRIRFEERELMEIDKELIPEIKTRYHKRPLSKALIREFRRKLISFNPDDLIVSIFCAAQLNLFVLDSTLLNEIEKHIEWLNNEKRLNDNQYKLAKMGIQFAKNHNK